MSHIRIGNNRLILTGIILMLLYSNNQYAQNYEQHAWKDMLNMINKKLESRPNDPELYFNRGGINYKLGLLHNSIDDFNMTLALDSNYFEAYINIGVIYYETGDYNSSLTCYLKGLRRDSNNNKLIRGVGSAHFKLNNFNKAICYFSNAIDKGDNYYVTWMNRGLAYQKLGEYENSIKDFYKAIELNTKSSKAHFNIAYSFLMTNQLELAKHYLDISYNLNSKNPYCLYYYALYYLKKHEISKSCIYYQKAINHGFEPIKK